MSIAANRDLSVLTRLSDTTECTAFIVEGIGMSVEKVDGDEPSGPLVYQSCAVLFVVVKLELPNLITLVLHSA